MKLAIVTAYPPSKVTLNEYGYHLIENFKKQEEITELIILTDMLPEDTTANTKHNGCTITYIKCWKFNSYFNVMSVMKIIKKVTPDAVLFNMQFMKFGDQKIAAALGLFLPSLCVSRKIPTIVLLHNILEQVDLGNAGFTKNKWIQKIYNFIGTQLTQILLKADIVAVTMNKYVEILDDKYKTKNVVMIPHGTFELPAHPIFELPKGAFKVMTFGKFGTYKRIEILIEAVEKIRSISKVDIEIVIAGTDNPNMVGYLESMRKKFVHVSQLTFTGYVQEEDVATLFQESGLVVFPYTATTGSSGVLHQAGSYGKAVVMPSLGDLDLLVKEEGYDGVFFEPDNVESLAVAILKIIENPAYRIALGKKNYEAATAYPMDVITAKYISCFQEVMNLKTLSSPYNF